MGTQTTTSLTALPVPVYVYLAMGIPLCPRAGTDLQLHRPNQARRFAKSTSARHPLP